MSAQGYNQSMMPPPPTGNMFSGGTNSNVPSSSGAPPTSTSKVPSSMPQGGVPPPGNPPMHSPYSQHYPHNQGNYGRPGMTPGTYGQYGGPSPYGAINRNSYNPSFPSNGPSTSQHPSGSFGSYGGPQSAPHGPPHGAPIGLPSHGGHTPPYPMMNSSAPPTSGATSPGVHPPTGAQKAAEAAMLAAAASRAPGPPTSTGPTGYSSPPNPRSGPGSSQFGSMSPVASGSSKSVAHAPWKDVQPHTGGQYPAHHRPYPGMAPSPQGYPDQKGPIGAFGPHGGPVTPHHMDSSGHTVGPHHGMPPHHSGPQWGPHSSSGHASHGVGYPGYPHGMGPHGMASPPNAPHAANTYPESPAAGHGWPPQQPPTTMGSPPHSSMGPPRPSASPSPVTQSVAPSSSGSTTVTSSSGRPPHVSSPLTTSADRPPSSNMPPPPPSIHSEDSQGSTDSGGTVSKPKQKPDPKHPGHGGLPPPVPFDVVPPYGPGPHGMPGSQHHQGGGISHMRHMTHPMSGGPAGPMASGPHTGVTHGPGAHGPGGPSPHGSSSTGPLGSHPPGPHGPHGPMAHGPGGPGSHGTAGPIPHSSAGHGPHTLSAPGPHGPGGPSPHGTGGPPGFQPSSTHLPQHLPRPSSGPSPGAGSDSSPVPLGHPHHPPTPNSGGMMSPPPPPGPLSDGPPSQYSASPKPQIPPPIRKPSAQDKLMQLYTMGPEPDRRSFLDALFSFNEEKGSPITAMPQVSKQPLDLYKLYMQVREKGGMVEVTKNKTWKDVAQVLNIGCSASAAFTVRKNYIKYLFGYECKFDRGDVDPGPIVADLEAQTNKKGKKKTAAEQQLATSQQPPNIPSPGSGNSQDGFTRPPSHGMMDGGYGSPIGGAGGAGAPPSGGIAPSASAPGFPGPQGIVMGVPNQSHAGPNNPAMMPGPPISAGDSINVRDPFSDDPSGAHSPYGPRPGMPPFSGPPAGPNQGPNAYFGRPGQGPNYGPAPFGPNAVGTQRPEAYTPGGSGPNWSGPPREGGFPNRDSYPGGGAGFRGAVPGQGYPPFSQSRFDSGITSPPSSMGPPSGPPVSSTVQASSASAPSSTTTVAASSSAVLESSIGGSTIMTTSTTTPASSGSSVSIVASDSGGPLPRPPPPPSTPSSTAPSSIGNSLIRPGAPGVSSPRPPTPGQVPQHSERAPHPYGFPHGPPYSQAGHYGGPQRPFDPFYAQRFGVPQVRGQTEPMFHPKRHPDFQPRPDSGFGYPGYSSSHGPRPQSDSGMMSPPHMPPPTSRPGPDHHWGPSQRFPPPSTSGSFQPRPFHPTSSPHRPGFPGSDHPTAMRPPHPVQPSTGPIGYPRKEIPFPADSVEAVTPVLAKRKRLCSKDLGQVDPWRLLMSLRSGLLAEATWAIDVLNIMLYDDQTIVYFGLAHLPGLIDVLLDHFRRYLKEIFNIVGDMEADLPEDDDAERESREGDRGSLEKSAEADEGYVFKVMDSEEENFTYRTREGKDVKVVNRKEPPGLVGSPNDDPDYLCEPEQDVLGTTNTVDSDVSYIYTRFHSVTDMSSCRRQFLGLEKSRRYTAQVPPQKKSHDASAVSKNTKAVVDLKPKIAAESDSPPNVKLESPSLVDEKTMPTTTLIDPDKDDIAAVSAIVDKKEVIETEDANKENRRREPQTLKKSGIKTTNANGAVSKYAPCANESDRDILETAASGRKRKASESANAKSEGLESESYVRDPPIFNYNCEGQDELVRRCVALSNVFRSLSFIPGNDHELGKHSGFLGTLGRLLLLHHDHAPKTANQSSKQRYENLAMAEEDLAVIESEDSPEKAEKEWWWSCLDQLRENFLVILANIAGAFQLNNHPEELIMPLLDGMLHWSVCPSSYARDPLPTLPAHSVLSPQRLVLEALCKMSIHESNVDLLLATPPFTRIDRLLAILTEMLSNRRDQVTREFAVVLLSNLSPADSFIGRCIASQTGSVSQFISFLEEYDAVAANVASANGIHSLRDNPEHTLGTSLDMLRRIGTTLVNLSRVPENATIFQQFQSRLLDLAMSQVLDQQVATRIAEVLFQVSEPPPLDSSVTGVRVRAEASKSQSSLRTSNFLPATTFPPTSSSSSSNSETKPTATAKANSSEKDKKAEEKPVVSKDLKPEESVADSKESPDEAMTTSQSDSDAESVKVINMDTDSPVKPDSASVPTSVVDAAPAEAKTEKSDDPSVIPPPPSTIGNGVSSNAPSTPSGTEDEDSSSSQRQAGDALSSSSTPSSSSSSLPTTTKIGGVSPNGSKNTANSNGTTQPLAAVS